MCVSFILAPFCPSVSLPFHRVFLYMCALADGAECALVRRPRPSGSSCLTLVTAAGGGSTSCKRDPFSIVTTWSCLALGTAAAAGSTSCKRDSSTVTTCGIFLGKGFMAHSGLHNSCSYHRSQLQKKTLFSDNLVLFADSIREYSCFTSSPLLVHRFKNKFFSPVTTCSCMLTLSRTEQFLPHFGRCFFFYYHLRRAPIFARPFQHISNLWGQSQSSLFK